MGAVKFFTSPGSKESSQDLPNLPMITACYKTIKQNEAISIMTIFNIVLNLVVVHARPSSFVVLKLVIVPAQPGVGLNLVVVSTQPGIAVWKDNTSVGGIKLVIVPSQLGVAVHRDNTSVDGIKLVVVPAQLGITIRKGSTAIGRNEMSLVVIPA